MQARGPLMIEHRLIERMISVMARALDRAEQTRAIDPGFIDTAVDFMRVYADRTHHGKEEDILFRFLEGKYLSEPDDRLMQELIADHVLGRQITRELVDANEKYRSGDDAALAAVTAHLGTLVEFYPRHIEKEDRDFFLASRAYMTDEEDQVMLAEMMEFDRKMIHEKYDAVVVNLEG